MGWGGVGWGGVGWGGVGWGGVGWKVENTYVFSKEFWGFLIWLMPRDVQLAGRSSCMGSACIMSDPADVPLVHGNCDDAITKTSGVQMRRGGGNLSGSRR